MTPTIAPGEDVTIDSLAYASSAPHRWDVVALEVPRFSDSVVLKRVIALPGETILLASTGIVVNGTPLVMPAPLSNVVYCPPGSVRALKSSPVTYPYTVPSDAYFVVGDNWTNSYDSRSYGAVPRSSILGKVRNK
jgi:signal peptidase I